MSGFNFERNLPHQMEAVNSILGVFHDLAVSPSTGKVAERCANPVIDVKNQKPQYIDNLIKVQTRNQIDTHSQKYRKNDSQVLDVAMETGTGKTYTYTKTIFELNRQFGINKFIVIVPTLSIKAGTVNFLRSEAAKSHFRQDYERELKIYVVESRKASKKNKKSYMPQAVSQFVEANNFNKKHIHIMVINAGMINSTTMAEIFDVTLFDQHNTPFKAIASIHPFTIIDEPHKFSQENKTWSNIQLFGSQFILRYGATFNDQYENLLYQLTAVDAFNQDLVKGVVTHIEKFQEGEKVSVRLKSLDGKQATFELHDHEKKKTVKVGKKDSLATVHPEMSGVTVENLNKSVLLLSNGLEVKRGDRLNPFSYAEKLQDKMMREAVKNHFMLEKELLTREVKIKPLTLFFIDDIEGYRGAHQIGGALRTRFEAMVKAEAKKLLETETDQFYKGYLTKTLDHLSHVHGGYFSKDNTENDEKIQKEIAEILHDKETLLSLDNPRRFIFSKWTLREGWDNPNVFQICKLRSSGSQTSKLQEVGRGLRLPVNEYMSRVKDERFDLHYYVDFTEQDFANSLVDEINEKSGTTSQVPTELTKEMITKILSTYPDREEDELLTKLTDDHIIKRSNAFWEGGYEKVAAMFPKAFGGGLKQGKVRNAGSTPTETTMRAGKYAELKQLWERINQKVVMEYKIDSEEQFKELLLAYFKDSKDKFKVQGSFTQTQKLKVENNVAFFVDDQSIQDEILPIITMSYKEFVFELAEMLSVNVRTLHSVFLKIKNTLDINLYLNMQTIRSVTAGFNKFLLDNAFNLFKVDYAKVSNTVHPTYFTDVSGAPLPKVKAGRLGINSNPKEKVSKNYLFEELFFDSTLEAKNIVENIQEVTVFTKIPRNTIRIPVAGGGSYSPDFAYVIQTTDEKRTLNLIVETKDKEKRDLFKDEEQKIKHAEQLFNHLNPEIKVVFQTQFKDNRMVDIIKDCLP